MKKCVLFVSALSIALSLPAQKKSAASSDPAPTPAATRLAGIDLKKATEQRSLVSNLAFRSVGPTVMSGRVVDIETDPQDATKFYVAYASGGLWYTENNGTTFSPLFDNEPSMTIGDVAIDWTNHDKPVIWIGTGENNSSRSSYSGTGIYRSDDKGKTWERRGLEEIQHTGSVLVKPGKSDDLLVGAIGHLYSASKDRGVYHSTDGGKTWKQTLFIDENTGVIELKRDPSNADVIYASAWHRERRAWNFTESGKSSGIYKSMDGGETWTLLTGPKSGFAQGDGVGRIGISVFASNPRIIYAVLDNQSHRPADADKKPDSNLKPRDFEKMTKEDFLKIEKEKLEKFLSDNGFAERYPADTVISMVKRNSIKPAALYDYVNDANNQLFDTPVIGGEVYRSDDAGASWKKVNTAYLEDFYYTYGYYFGKITVNPSNADEVFICGVPVMRSSDGGKTFASIDGDNTHGDYHVVWCDPSRSGHIITGSDGGVNISWDNGKSWFKCNTPAVGQFYSVNVDDAKPYNIYGGLQDNGVWVGPSDYQFSLGWYGYGQYPWKFIYGGDGMQVMVDNRDNKTVYTGSQFGYYGRVNRETGEASSVRPEHNLGEKPLRYNWQCPIWLSVHNRDILYFGANKLYRSMNKGDSFTAISGDLTRGGREGDVPYGTITTVHESPLKFGLLYTGSDDGYIYVSRDGGASWKRISDNLPQHLRVSRVQASAFVEGRVYAALSGFQWDHFEPYLYVSDDFGTNWTRIGTDLPKEPINVVREDPENADLLFVGTDNGLYTSLDRGKSFMHMMNNFPAVAVHDLVIQPREHDLVVGTHGRSIYVTNISLLEQLRDSIRSKAVFLFPVAKPGERDKEISAGYYLQHAGKTTLRLKTSGGLVVRESSDDGETGINMMTIQLSSDSAHTADFIRELRKSNPDFKAEGKTLSLPEGKYFLDCSISGTTVSTVTIDVPRRKNNSQVPEKPENEEERD